MGKKNSPGCGEDCCPIEVCDGCCAEGIQKPEYLRPLYPGATIEPYPYINSWDPECCCLTQKWGVILETNPQTGLEIPIESCCKLLQKTELEIVWKRQDWNVQIAPQELRGQPYCCGEPPNPLPPEICGTECCITGEYQICEFKEKRIVKSRVDFAVGFFLTGVETTWSVQPFTCNGETECKVIMTTTFYGIAKHRINRSFTSWTNSWNTQLGPCQFVTGWVGTIGTASLPPDCNWEYRDLPGDWLNNYTGTNCDGLNNNKLTTLCFKRIKTYTITEWNNLTTGSHYFQDTDVLEEGCEDPNCGSSCVSNLYSELVSIAPPALNLPDICSNPPSPIRHTLSGAFTCFYCTDKWSQVCFRQEDPEDCWYFVSFGGDCPERTCAADVRTLTVDVFCPPSPSPPGPCRSTFPQAFETWIISQPCPPPCSTGWVGPLDDLCGGSTTRTDYCNCRNEAGQVVYWPGNCIGGVNICVNTDTCPECFEDWIPPCRPAECCNDNVFSGYDCYRHIYTSRDIYRYTKQHIVESMDLTCEGSEGDPTCEFSPGLMQVNVEYPSDRTPDPVNWNSITYDCETDSCEVTSKQITGIDAQIFITVEGFVAGVQDGGQPDLYYKIGNSEITGPITAPPDNTWTKATTNPFFLPAVNNNQWISFTCYSPTGVDRTRTISVYIINPAINLDTFNITSVSCPDYIPDPTPNWGDLWHDVGSNEQNIQSARFLGINRALSIKLDLDTNTQPTLYYKISTASLAGLQPIGSPDPSWIAVTVDTTITVNPDAWLNFRCYNPDFTVAARNFDVINISDNNTLLDTINYQSY
jgi:hypothetical protein